MDEMLEVPRWALEFILENANFQDAGGWPEGWPSDKMEKAKAALEAALSKKIKA